MTHSSLIAPSTLLLSRARSGASPRPQEQRTAEHEDQQAEQHADAGGAEAVVPADGLAEIAGEDGADRGASVNPHVEDGVGAVAANVGARIELADDHRDVRLEEARADDDEGQGQPEDVDRRIALAAVPSNAIRKCPTVSRMAPNSTALRWPR